MIEKTNKENNIIMLYRCETPLHVGSGNEMGVVDLPIQREKHTGFPKMEASGIKGVFRDYFEEMGTKKKAINVDKLFGTMKENDSPDKQAGGLIFTDARLLLFPIKAGKDIFRWITCPYVVQRFVRELGRYQKQEEQKRIESILSKENLYENLEKGKVYIIKKEKEKEKEKEKVQLGEFEFESEMIENADFIPIIEQICDSNYLKRKLEKGIVLVSDEVFGYFTEMNTQIDTSLMKTDVVLKF